MVYSFIKIYEMGTTVTVLEVRAKDLHDAKRKAIALNKDYDIIAVNGEWCY